MSPCRRRDDVHQRGTGVTGQKDGPAGVLPALPAAGYRALFDASPLGLSIATLDGQIVAANPSLCRMLGRPQQEVIGATFLSMTHPDDVERNRAVYRKLVDGDRSSFTVEKRFLTGTGEVAWARVTVALIRDDTGTPRMAAGITEDITAERQTAGDLAFAQSLLRVAGDLALVGGWAVSVPGGEVTWSEEIYRILDAPPGSPTTIMQEARLCTPEDEARLTRAVERCAADGTPVDMELDMVAFTGRALRVHVRGQAERNADGSIVRVVGAFQDISELVAAHDHAERVEGLLQEAMHSMSDAFTVYDRDFRIVYLNPQAERDLRLNADEVVGKVLWDEFPATVQTELFEVFTRCMATGEPATLEEFWFPPLERWFELRVHPSPQTLSVYFRDITARRKAEQQAIRAQRMESLGTLAGGIAHDLNNVLAPILMSTELLARDETDPRRRKLLETLVSSTTRGADMVRQVLSFARGVGGDRLEVDPAELLDGVLRIVRETFPRNITIDCRVDPPVATLQADPTQLHQVLMNLLVNARDAMPDGGRIRCAAQVVTIDEQYASVTMGLEAGDYVLIEVTDTGQGMPADVLDRIFEPFFTTKEVGVGTGLGLSTSLAIVESHGGHLDVYSEPGLGTTFRVYLPTPHDAPEARERVDVPDAVLRGRGETVLVVDDEPMILEVTERGLVDAGYHVIIAPDGAEAVALFANDPHAVDLVLTDMMMPVMDGAATVHALRSLRSDVRVIVTSGLDAGDHAERAAALGVDHVLAKPFSTAALLRTVRSVLDAEAQ